MYRDILRRLNFAAFLAIALFSVTLQSTIFAYYPLQFFKPDVLLILIVYMGLKRDIVEGAVFTVLASIIGEAHSSSGHHYFLATNIYMFVIAKVMSRTVVVPDTLSSIGIVAGLTALKKLGLFLLLSFTNDARSAVWGFLLYLVPGILVQSLLTPACFAWFTTIDQKMSKDEQSGDELDITIN